MPGDHDAVDVRRGAARPRARPGRAHTTLALAPPNAKLFETATSIASSRASFGHVVEVALGIGLRVVRGRRRDLVLDRLDGDDVLDRAGGAEQVADHRLRAADGRLVGVLAEPDLRRCGLRRVVLRRARAVAVDVVRPRPGDAARGLQRGLDRARRRPRPPGAARSGGSRRPTGRSRAISARIGAPSSRARSSRISTSIPLPSPSERPSRSREYGAAGFGESDSSAVEARVEDAGERLRAAGQHGVGLAVADQLGGVADRVRARGAGGVDRQHRPLDVERAASASASACGVDEQQRAAGRAYSPFILPQVPLLGREQARRCRCRRRRPSARAGSRRRGWTPQCATASSAAFSAKSITGSRKPSGLQVVVLGRHRLLAPRRRAWSGSPPSAGARPARIATRAAAARPPRARRRSVPCAVIAPRPVTTTRRGSVMSVNTASSSEAAAQDERDVLSFETAREGERARQASRLARFRRRPSRAVAGGVEVSRGSASAAPCRGATASAATAALSAPAPPTRWPVAALTLLAAGRRVAEDARSAPASLASPPRRAAAVRGDVVDVAGRRRPPRASARSIALREPAALGVRRDQTLRVVGRAEAGDLGVDRARRARRARLALLEHEERARPRRAPCRRARGRTGRQAAAPSSLRLVEHAERVELRHVPPRSSRRRSRRRARRRPRRGGPRGSARPIADQRPPRAVPAK